MKYQYAIALLALASSALHAEELDMSVARTVSEIAVKAKRAPGAPRYSDVCFSPRWRRPMNADDPHDTFRDAKAFHATRFDWVYSNDPVWIAECRKRGYWFVGTLNTICPDAPGKSTREKGRILDKNGKRVAAPGMRGWANPGYWGCVNSPDYRTTFLAHGKILIDGGINAIQMDDPDINYAAVKWGGCYCEHCRSKAKKQGKTLPKDMMAFQKESTKEFYAFVRKELDKYAGRRIPWSSNNYDGRSGFPYDLFDYGTAELPHRSAKPDRLYRKISDEARSGRQQIYTFVSTDASLTRRVIATAYACGGHVIVPYDVYNGKEPRIFGKPQEYGDLYGFVRAMTTFLDGFEDAAVSGKGIEESRYGPALPVQVGVDNVYAFVRAEPGKADSSVVIHLVDWRESPQPFVLTLRKDCFFPGKEIAVTLCVPPQYERDAHAKASEQDNYSSLRKKQTVQAAVKGNSIEIPVPPLTPWGIIILDPKQ